MFESTFESFGTPDLPVPEGHVIFEFQVRAISVSVSLLTRTERALLRKPSFLSLYFLYRRMLITQLRIASPRYSSFSLSDLCPSAPLLSGTRCA